MLKFFLQQQQHKQQKQQQKQQRKQQQTKTVPAKTMAMIKTNTDDNHNFSKSKEQTYSEN